jgi:hypothetical protein
MTVRNPWLDLTFDALQLGIEAQTVIGLRVMKALTGGPGANAEASRMITEKIEAAMSVQASLLDGALTNAPHVGPARAVAHYRKAVLANRKRLLAGG